MKLKKLAVIGHPVAHSLSPVMQQAALRKLHLPYQYKKIHVLPQDLQTFCQKSKRGKHALAGFNITLPHKENVLPYLDWISPLARLVGAVNTVVNSRGRLLGFNTDGLGYVESLREETRFLLQGARISLLGAGGAAHGLAVALAQGQAKHITLANRSLSRAQKLAKHLKAHFPQTGFAALPLQGKSFQEALIRSQLITNTTSASLSSTTSKTGASVDEVFPGFPWDKLKPKTILSDLVYQPLITPFLKRAKLCQLTLHPGLGMLVHQGALSFQLWTGHYPDVKLMRNVVERALSAKVKN